MASYNAKIDLSVAVDKALSNLNKIERALEKIQATANNVKAFGKTDVSQAVRSFNVLKGSVTGVGKVLAGLGNIVKGVTSNFGSLATGLAGLEILNVANNIDKLQNPFTQLASVLLKSTEAVLDLGASAAATAVQNAALFSSVAAGTTLLVAFGPQIATVTGRLLKLAGVAGEAKVPLNELINTYSKLSGAFDDSFASFDLSIQQKIVEEYRQKLFEVSETVSELGRRKQSLQTTLNRYNSSSATAEKIAKKLVDVNARLNEELREQADLLRRASGVNVTELEAAKGRKSIETRQRADVFRGEQYNRAVQVRKSWTEFFRQAEEISLQQTKDRIDLQKILGELEEKSARDINRRLDLQAQLTQELQRTADAARFRARQAPEQLRLPAFQERGLKLLDDSVRLNESQLRIETALNGERARGVRFLEKQTQEERRQLDLGITGTRTNLLPQGAFSLREEQAQAVAAARATERLAVNQRLKQTASGIVTQLNLQLAIAEKLRAPTQLITDEFERQLQILKQSGQLAGNFSPIEGREDLPGSPKFLKAQKRRRSEALSNAIIGGAFPLLFGQGGFAAAGGGLGGLGGGLLGGQFGFGLSLVGTALGAAADEFVSKIDKVAKSLADPAAALEALEEAGFKVDASIKSQVESLLEAGRAYEAQELIFQQINETVGPKGVSLLNAYQQQSEKLNDKYRELSLALTRELLPVLVGLIKVINDIGDIPYLKEAFKASLINPITGPLVLAGGGLSKIGEQEAARVGEDVRLSPEQQAAAAELAETNKKLEDSLRLQVELSEKKFAASELNKKVDFEAWRIAQEQVIQQEYRIRNEEIYNRFKEENLSQEVRGLLVQENINKRNADLAKQQAAEAQIITQQVQEQTRALKDASQIQLLTLDLESRLASKQFEYEKGILQVALETATTKGKITEQTKIRLKLAKLEFEEELRKIRITIQRSKLQLQLEQAVEKTIKQKIKENAENQKLVDKLKELLIIQEIQTKKAALKLSFVEKEAKIATQAAKEQYELSVKQAKEAQRSAKAARAVAQAQQKAAASAASYASSLERAEESMRRTTTATFQVSDAVAQQIRGGRTFQSPEELFGFLREAEKPFIELEQKSRVLAEAQRVQQQSVDALSLGMDGFAKQLERYAEGIARSGGVFREFAASKEEASLPALAATREEENESDLTPFATGGYVTKPTSALIGEAGPEYVIREDQMKEAMVRYASGKRGDDVIPDGATSTNISVKTGPVMQMGGQDYVSRADFEKGLRNVSNSVLATIRRSPNTRSRLGI